MTTFAGQMDFDGAQPFNVDLSAKDADLYPPAQHGKLGRATVPVVAQEISPDRDLYPPMRYGVRPLFTRIARR